MTSSAQIRNNTCVVTLVGEFDRANVDKLHREIEWCLRSTSSVLFDFGGVTYLNGALLSLLHDIGKRVGDSGSLGVARPLERIEKLFSVAGLTDLPNFRVFPTLEEALEVVDRD